MQAPTQQQATPGNRINNMESQGGWRRVLSNLETKNRFSTLEVSDHDDNPIATSFTPVKPVIPSPPRNPSGLHLPDV